MTSGDSVKLLSDLLQRRPIVDRLHEGPADKRTLTEELDCSRSTVDRAIRELEADDFVTYDGGRYELTSFGEWMADSVGDLLAEMGVARDLQSVLEHLPVERFDLDMRRLADADVFLPEPGNPWAMVNHHVGVLERADEIRALLPLTGLHGHEAVHDRIVDAGARAELIACPEVVRTLTADPRFVEKTDAMAATGRFDLFQLNERPPYFLGLIDDVVQIGVDDDGDPKAMIESTNPDVRNWAEATYERFKREATRIELADAVASPDESALD